MKRVLALFFCVTILLTLMACGKKKEIEEVPETLPVKTVDALSYHNGTTTLRFTYSEEKWSWVDGKEENFPLDDTVITAILEQLPVILESAPLSNAEDLSVYCLAEPSRYLTITSGEETKTVYFGVCTEESVAAAQTSSEEDETTDDSKKSEKEKPLRPVNAKVGSWYMRRSDGTDIYEVPTDFVEKLNKEIYEMVTLPQLPELTEETLTFISVYQSEEKTTHCLRTEEGWVSNSKDVTATVQKAVKEMAGLQLSRCVDYYPSEGVAALCGLEEETTKITFKYKNAVGTDSELLITIGAATETGEGNYVTINEDPAIYLMPTDQLSTLLMLVA